MRAAWRSVGAFLLFLGLVACGGARHRKVNGPPPEYELPDEPGVADAGAPPPADGAASSADGGR